MTYDSTVMSVKSMTDYGRANIEQHPSVVGTGITHSLITGVDNDINPGYQIVIYLRDYSGLQAVPTNINGIRVVYKIIGEVRALVDQNQYRPLQAGAQITSNGSRIPSTGCYVGTIGGFPKLPDGRNVILSNTHVIGNQTPAYNTGKIGDKIYQPGCVPNGPIGTVEKIIPVLSSGNKVDASYASIDSGVSITNSNICGNVFGTGAVKPSLGMKVIKYGRTTGCTRSSIEALDVNVDVNYAESPGVITGSFTGQFSVTNPFSAGGDSGSGVLTDDGNYNPVGLLFAGNSNITFCNVMFDVEDELGVSFGPRPTGTQPTVTQPTVTQPTVTQPTGTQPTDEIRFSCKEFVPGVKICVFDPQGNYTDLAACMAECSGITMPTGTQPTGTQPTVTEPTGTGSMRFTCKELIPGVRSCVYDPQGNYTDLGKCMAECSGATQPTGTGPSITQPTSTEPSETQPSGTQPKQVCSSKNITIAGRCINKYYLYGGIGVATIGGIGIYLRKKNII